MGFIDKIKEAVTGHEDQVNQGIDQAGDAVDARTGGQHADKVDQGQDFLKDQLGTQAQPGQEPAAEQPPAQEPPA